MVAKPTGCHHSLPQSPSPVPTADARALQADGTGDTVPSLAGSHPAGMITVTWYDLRPDQVTAQKKQAYVDAVRKLLPGASGGAAAMRMCRHST